jgi:hypothetical protein
MATLEHRRVRSAADLRVGRARPVAQRLSPLGWVFAALAAVWVVVQLRVLLDPGALDPIDYENDLLLALRTLGDASLIALPAALSFGYPRVERRNLWLWWGAIVLAFTQLAQPFEGIVRDWAVQQIDPEAGLGPTTAPGATLLLLQAVVTVVVIGGLWSLSAGLRDAGARPRRAVLVAVAAFGAALPLLTLPLVADAIDSYRLAGLAYVGTTVLGAVGSAMALIVGARLVLGAPAGLVPRRAWIVGAIAGVLVVLAHVAAWITVPGIAATLPIVAFAVLASGPWIALAGAFALGLGRGPRLRRRQFQVWSTLAEAA